MKVVEKLNSFKQKKFLHEVGYLYFSALVNGGCLFLINVLLGRFLDQSEFGIFSLSLLLLSTVAEISDLGLNAGLLRFAPYYLANNETNKLKQLVKTVWRWRIGLTSVLTIGGIILSYPISKYLLNQEQIAGQVAFAFLGIGGVILLGFVSTYLQAERRFLHTATIQILKGTLRLFLVGLFLALGFRNIYPFLAVYIFIPWVLFLINYKFLPAGFNNVQVGDEEKKKLHSQLANFSLWLTMWSVLSIVSARIDQVMVSRYLGLESVAIYSAAYVLVQLFPIISQSISSVLTPRINSLTTKSDLKLFIRRAFKWISVGVLGIAILVYPSQYLIYLLFGSKYSAAMPVYLVLAFSLTINLLAIPFSLAIYAFNKTSFMAVSGVIQILINFFGNLLLIPMFGVMGAAYTFALGIIGSLLYNFFSFLYLIKFREIKVQ